MRCGTATKVAVRPGQTRYADGGMQSLVRLIPHWLAWPMSALATLAAGTGAVLFFFSAVFGESQTAVWGGVVFVAAAVLWYLGDMAASNRPFD